MIEKLGDDYEVYIQKILNDSFDEYCFDMEFHAEWVTKNLATDTRLEDLWELSANVDYPLPDVTIMLPASISSIEIKKFVGKLGESNFRGAVSIIQYYDTDSYESRKKDPEMIKEETEETEHFAEKDIYSIFVYGGRVDCDVRRNVKITDVNNETRNEIICQMVDHGVLIMDVTKDGIYTEKVENGMRFHYDNDIWMERCACVQDEVKVNKTSKSDDVLVLKIDTINSSTYGIEKDRLIPILAEDMQMLENYFAEKEAPSIETYESVEDQPWVYESYLYVIDSFEFLKILDSNNDGVIDKKDPAHKQIMIWGRPEQLDTIPSYSIPNMRNISDEDSIIIDVTEVNKEDENGNFIRYESSVSISGEIYGIREYSLDMSEISGEVK